MATPPKESRLQVPVRALEGIEAALRAKAAKPRMVTGYSSIIKDLAPTVEQFLAAGYSLEDVAAEFAPYGIANFDPAEFVRQYEAYRARTHRGATSNGAPAPAPANKPAGTPKPKPKPAGNVEFQSVDPTDREAMSKL